MQPPTAGPAYSDQRVAGRPDACFRGAARPADACFLTLARTNGPATVLVPWANHACVRRPTHAIAFIVRRPWWRYRVGDAGIIALGWAVRLVSAGRASRDDVVEHADVPEAVDRRLGHLLSGCREMTRTQRRRASVALAGIIGAGRSDDLCEGLPASGDVEGAAPGGGLFGRVRSEQLLGGVRGRSGRSVHAPNGSEDQTGCDEDRGDRCSNQRRSLLRAPSLFCGGDLLPHRIVQLACLGDRRPRPLVENVP